MSNKSDKNFVSSTKNKIATSFVAQCSNKNEIQHSSKSLSKIRPYKSVAEEKNIITISSDSDSEGSVSKSNNNESHSKKRKSQYPLSDISRSKKKKFSSTSTNNYIPTVITTTIPNFCRRKKITMNSDSEDDFIKPNMTRVQTKKKGDFSKNKNKIQAVVKKQKWLEDIDNNLNFKLNKTLKSNYVINPLNEKHLHMTMEISEKKRSKTNNVESNIVKDKVTSTLPENRKYQNHFNSGKPKNHGSKKLPKGKPNCLGDLYFLRTGVLDSLKSEEFENLIEEYSGCVVHAVSKNVNYVVAGDNAGSAKLKKAKKYNIPILNEDDLLNMILRNSGLKETYGLTGTSSSKHVGISESVMLEESEQFIVTKNSEKESLIEIEINEKINSKTLNKNSSFKNNDSNLSKNENMVEAVVVKEQKLMKDVDNNLNYHTNFNSNKAIRSENSETESLIEINKKINSKTLNKNNSLKNNDSNLLKNENKVEAVVVKEPKLLKGVDDNLTNRENFNSNKTLKDLNNYDMNSLNKNQLPMTMEIPEKKRIETNNVELNIIKDTSLDDNEKLADSRNDNQEHFEKRRYCAKMFQNYLNREGPKNHGSKELPKGKPNCLADLCFLRTGVLDSLKSEEFENLIKEYGGRVVHAVSRKVNYVVAGDDAGPAKLKKAKNYNISILNEDDLLNMILRKSGLKETYGLTETSSSKHVDKSELFMFLESEELTLSKNSENNKENDLKKGIKKLEEKSEKLLEIDSENKNSKKIDTNTVSLSEKYKPKELKNIVGQQMNNSNMNKLKTWLHDWYKNQKLRNYKKFDPPSRWNKTYDGKYCKCVLLSGSPGVGKSIIATLVSESLGYKIVEFNASNTRSKIQLQKEVSSALTMHNISFQHRLKGVTKRVLFMKEVDGMTTSSDDGGIEELINLIKITKIPIIFICNNITQQKIKYLANHCFNLTFEKPKLQQILDFLIPICEKEKIELKPEMLRQIIDGTACDLRSSLNQISMITNLENWTNLEKVQKNEKPTKIVLDPWQTCKTVFNEEDQKKLTLFNKSKLFFHDSSLGPLFVQENYLNVRPNVNDKKIMKHVAAAAEAISMGATIDRKIRETNNWSLLDIQAIYSSVLPGYYMSGIFTAPIDFPAYIGKYSKTVKHKRLNNDLTFHSRLQISGGTLAMNLDYSKNLLMSIITPLKKNRVSEAMQVMKSYQLLKNDLYILLKLSTWSKQDNIMGGIDSKIKTDFKKLYDKEVPTFFYSSNDWILKEKRSALYCKNILEERNGRDYDYSKSNYRFKIKFKPKS